MGSVAHICKSIREPSSSTWSNAGQAMAQPFQTLWSRNGLMVVEGNGNGSLMLYMPGISTLFWKVSPSCCSCPCCCLGLRSVQIYGQNKHIVACIVIGTTTFGAVFYALIVVAALISDVCPFQTPASNRLRSIGQCVVRFHNLLQKGNQTIFSSLLRFVSYIPYITITLLHSFASCISRRLSSQYAIENTDAPCIRWLLETSDDPNVITTAASWFLRSSGHQIWMYLAPCSGCETLSWIASRTHSMVNRNFLTLAEIVRLHVERPSCISTSKDGHWMPDPSFCVPLMIQNSHLPAPLVCMMPIG
ncbi:hypothetical protein DFJ58DRAFT_153171 [Suillus subalutaceus]|uniref:uncharacterized protein n=1 Tax=Suillus subalutaceus TaxID=48586 RepID=UPI001B875CB2|nr:uncharacterized protein DFJ58DRAFT_153171 [Suillus subalutaceus]KAG1865835.1 hypothetical protein DFJ58DRAFT_153171 [Suillus subalutaceus]